MNQLFLIEQEDHNRDNVRAKDLPTMFLKKYRESFGTLIVEHDRTVSCEINGPRK